MTHRPSKSGFTLLELIVSIVILTLIVLMVSQVFTSSTSAIERGSDDALLDETARFVLDNLQTDISQAIVRTNIPFRILANSVGDTLYCISTSYRNPNQPRPRDMTPIQIRPMQRQELESTLNYRIIFKSIGGSWSDSVRSRKKLIEQSNYYREEAVGLSDENEKEYTSGLDDHSGLTAQAVLTLVEFRINGNSSSNLEGLPQTSDLPRFVDVIVGLASANDMRQAMRIYETQGSNEAEVHLANHERIYTRRIFVPNIGTTLLDLE